MTTTTNPLTTLAKPPHGIVGSIDNAAIDAAGGDVLVARSVVEAVEPLIVDDVVARIVRAATEAWEWSTRIHYTDGRAPADGEPMAFMLAKLAVDGLNQDDNAEFRQGRAIDRSEVVRRAVFRLRDGSTLIGPWHVAVEPDFPGQAQP